ncbi:HAD-IIIC family phosphatase [Bacillus bingmayongensis]|uniref:HAD-IIIC family phosphatase n=1 Tax=Bacillus bingmayongensis TaxID=1150157 RepID=UPI0002D47D9F|nr:HAD-IIIC family phosphatase [Bacillus bingmayongensis]MBY0596364.1 HAD-IIIC family phosphatase [Bacillus bingmayongensis]
MNKKVKCVVWDLDNTLWEGILLESDEVKLKESMKEILTQLDERGILHSIASRNDKQTVLNKLKEFGIDHFFLYPEINWNAKSTSIDKISKNLNINKDTLLFIDDQVFEREEVQSVHPTITCWDAKNYKDLIEDIRLKPDFITEDAKRRREMYLEDDCRKKDEDSFEGPSEQFLAGLNLKFSIMHAEENDLRRAEELTVRTNQLNTSGYTYDYKELNHFRVSDSHILLICELDDKYGSYGKIGLSLIEEKNNAWHIKLLLMSCRVMSRGVGTILLTAILNEAKKQGKKVFADFKQTDRNRVMYITYKFANFREVSSDAEGYILFENDLNQLQAYPPYVEVVSDFGMKISAGK